MDVRQNSCQPAPILSSANDLLHGADCTSIPPLANIVLSLFAFHEKAGRTQEVLSCFL
jgi:hypothetical protein